MGILDSILANGGNVKLALEDQEILQGLDGDAQGCLCRSSQVIRLWIRPVF